MTKYCFQAAWHYNNRYGIQPPPNCHPEIVNDTKETITIPNECPNEPFTIYRFENNSWYKTSSPSLKCDNTGDILIALARKSASLTTPEQCSFLGMGRFKIEFKIPSDPPTNTQEQTFISNEFRGKRRHFPPTGHRTFLPSNLQRPDFPHLHNAQTRSGTGNYHFNSHYPHHPAIPSQKARNPNAACRKYSPV